LIPAWGAAIGVAAAGGYHNGDEGNMADFGGIAGEQLKSLIERIERLEEEKRALGEDIKVTGFPETSSPGNLPFYERIKPTRRNISFRSHRW
jgi:hypothetical protein